MATKTITIMEDAYEILAKNKKDNESFSDVIRRTLSKKIEIEEFAGAWSKEFGDLVIKDIEDQRKDTEKRIKRIDRQFTA